MFDSSGSVRRADSPLRVEGASGAAAVGIDVAIAPRSKLGGANERVLVEHDRRLA